MTNNSGFTAYDEDCDYMADDAEAVVYLISLSGRLKNTALYVMKRHEAVLFCSRDETQSRNGNMSWAYCFTTHRRDWRDELKTFRKDDGRFGWLLEELGIVPIYRGGEVLADKSKPKKPALCKPAGTSMQLSLFDDCFAEVIGC